MAESRKFGDKVYGYQGRFAQKRLAQRHANILRGKGYFARVVRAWAYIPTGKRISWEVWGRLNPKKEGKRLWH